MGLTPVDPKEWDRVGALHIHPSERRSIYVEWSALRCERHILRLAGYSSGEAAFIKAPKLFEYRMLDKKLAAK